MQAMENPVLVTLTGKNAKVDLLNDRIIFSKLSHQQTGEQAVEILHSSITSTKLEHGYLQIVTASFSKSITFSASSENAFQLLKRELDRVIQDPTSTSSLKDLQVLEKMGELKDKGFITEEEFIAKKRQIFENGIDPANVEKIKKAMESAFIAEEEEKIRIIQEAEVVHKKQVEETKQGWRFFGAVIGYVYIFVALSAFVTGSFVNGFFMLLTTIALTPLIHFLTRRISKDKISHVPAAFRVILALITMFLSTLHYFDSPTQAQATTEATVSNAQLTPEEKKQRELNDEKMRQQFEAQWEKDQKKKTEEQDAKLKAEKAEREAEKVVQKAFDEENKEADADVEKLLESDSLSKMDCELNEAYISPEGWASLGVSEKENFTRVLMAYCSRHGGDGNIITIRNEMDGKELGSIGGFSGGFHVK